MRIGLRIQTGNIALCDNTLPICPDTASAISRAHILPQVEKLSLSSAMQNTFPGTISRCIGHDVLKYLTTCSCKVRGNDVGMEIGNIVICNNILKIYLSRIVSLLYFDYYSLYLY